MAPPDCSDIPAWIALSRAELPPRLAVQLLEHFHGPRELFAASPVEITAAAELSSAMLSRLLAQRPDEAGERDYAKLQAMGASVITVRDFNYPPLLRQTHDPPLLLYVLGELLEQDSLAVAVVGSRRCSPYGRLVAHKLAGELTAHGLTVVSGLASGIDGAAHRGALEAGGRTIGVIASGLDIDYPREHRELKEQIARQGAVVSEVPLGTAPTPARFPVRNRIIAGLSLGTLVVEAPERSGALITARLAAEQGRDVFAVPGNVNSFHARGCHQLIRDGAKLVDKVEDILEELNFESPSPQPPSSASSGLRSPGSRRAHRESAETKPGTGNLPVTETPLKRAKTESKEAKDSANIPRRKATPPPSREEVGVTSSAPQPLLLPAGFTSEENRIIACLSLQQKYVDEIIRETGLSAAQVSASLMLLELKGLVRRLPGNLFVRVK